MIWGMTLHPGEEWTRKIYHQEYLTIASLECRPDKIQGGTNPIACLMIKTDDNEHVLCTLEKGSANQQKLDLILEQRETVTFIVHGTGTVFLTGYTLESSVYQEGDGSGYDGVGLPSRGTPERRTPSSGHSPLSGGHRIQQSGTGSTGHMGTSHSSYSAPSSAVHMPGYAGSDLPEHRVSFTPTHHAVGTAQADLMHNGSEQPAGPSSGNSFQMVSPSGATVLSEPGPISSEGQLCVTTDIGTHSRENTNLSTLPPQTIQGSPPKGNNFSSPTQSFPMSSNFHQGNLQPPTRYAALRSSLSNHHQPASHIPMDHRHSPTNSSFLGSSSMVTKTNQSSITSPSRARQRSSRSNLHQPLGILPSDHHYSPTNPTFFIRPSSVVTKSNERSETLSAGVCGREKMAPSKVKSKVKQKTHACGFCPKMFAENHQLTAHLRTHTGEKPFQCGFCVKAFAVKGNLRTHERVHTGYKPYQCRFCVKAFAQVGALRGHERLHTGEKPFQCELCPRAFAVKNNLQKHERLHVAKPHLCPLCGRAFAEERALEEHRSKHNEMAEDNIQRVDTSVSLPLVSPRDFSEKA